MTKVYINGYALNCAQGNGVKQVQENLLSPLSSQKLALTVMQQPQHVPYFKSFSGLRLDLEGALALIEEQIFSAIESARWDKSDLAQIPIFFGSSSDFVFVIENQIFADVSIEHQYEFSLNRLTDFIKTKYHNRQVFGFSTSCTSSMNALKYAKQMLEQELIEKAIVIGFEFFNLLSIDNFSGLGLLSADFLPFLNNNGFILGEGIACVCISNEKPNKPSLSIASIASTIDQHNISSSSKEEVIRVMEQALNEANIQANDIKLIKAHGVGSVSDQAEQAAFEEIFSSQTNITFFKPLLGNLLGASGLLELTYLLACLDKGYLPMHPSAFAYTDNQYLVHAEAIDYADYFLMNTLGFGGNNISCVLSGEL